MSTAAPVPQVIELTAVARRRGQYLYRQFSVPVGVNRISVKLKKKGMGQVGVGLFDERGCDYQSPGFRGVLGQESREFFISADRATPGFRPGAIHPGTWTVMIPVFRAWTAMRLTVTLTLAFGPEPNETLPGPEQSVVSPAPGWYKGDMHCHTTHSSDAHHSGSSLTPGEWAAKAQEIGLHWVSLTDHNVTSQNWQLQQDAAETGVLLLAGEEMTNWFHGHATVTGLSPGDWIDFRQLPVRMPLGKGAGRIRDCIMKARSCGAYISAAHPLRLLVEWRFWDEAKADPEARPDGLEVWTGRFQYDNWESLKLWDRCLCRGWKVWANGGSDIHGMHNEEGFAPGQPTTVVYAESLSKAGILAALRQGRSYVARSPEGPELYLTARGPGGQDEMMGGTVYGAADDQVEVSMRAVGGAGKQLVLIRDGKVVMTAAITSNDQTVSVTQMVGGGGYVRAELRGKGEASLLRIWAYRLGMEALTNPIFLVQRDGLS